jgi:organic radical activating enzyme
MNTAPTQVLTRIPVMEQFYTLQGEGFWTGTAAYFIRLAGCDVGCVWCDVKESWTVAPGQWQEVEALADAALGSGTQRVVITGGEPVMYDLNPLVKALQERGLLVHIETSGVYPLQGDLDWICLSPKKFKPALQEYFDSADELKVIVFNKHDLQWAEEQAARCNPERTKFYLQPEWGKRENVHQIIDYIKAHPQWRLSLQTHKYLDIP